MQLDRSQPHSQYAWTSPFSSPDISNLYPSKPPKPCLKFKVCKTVHHHTIQINHHPHATISPVYYPDVYLQLNMFRASSFPSSGPTTTAVAVSDLPLERGDSSAVGRGRADRPNHDQQHSYHHDTKVKPEATTAVVELLMMGVRTPETCWVVNKRQDNKLEKFLHLVGDLFELMPCFLLGPPIYQSVWCNISKSIILWRITGKF